MTPRSSTLALLALNLTACAAEPPAPARPVVLVSVPPQAFFVRSVAGELVDVEVMIPPGASPATHEPSARQMRRASEASAYLAVGRESFAFERVWLERIVSANPRMRVVDGSAGTPCEADDPHVWVSPASARVMAENFAKALADLLPEHRGAVRRNLDALVAEIEALDRSFRESLEPWRGRSFLVFHAAWGCFARHYGLRQIAIEHGAREPAPTELAAVIRRAEADNVRVVFVQPHFDRRSAEVVAREIGARLVVVDPLSAEWRSSLERAVRAFEDSFRAGGGSTGRETGAAEISE